MTREHRSTTLSHGDRMRDLNHAAALLKLAHDLLSARCGCGPCELPTVLRLVISAHARVSTVATVMESDVERGFVTP